MSKNGGRTPHGAFTLSEIGARDGGCPRGRGSPGVGNRHAGKYREWTLLRQRGGGGGNATPLPTAARFQRVLLGSTGRQQKCPTNRVAVETAHATLRWKS